VLVEKGANKKTLETRIGSFRLNRSRYIAFRQRALARSRSLRRASAPQKMLLPFVGSGQDWHGQ
jgi:hypothetical protein